jgi:hypothetical protein
LPDTTFRIDVFASAAYNADGSGEAQDYLGSLEVTTDAQGQAIFDVPFSPPANLPIVTATATDPQGDTSEVSAARRRGAIEAPAPLIRGVPGQPLLISAASGRAVALQDPDAGPLDMTWDLTLSVTAGTLTLGGSAGLVGSGDGTQSLHYQGPLSALNAALQGLSYTSSPQSPISNSLSLLAVSDGATSAQAQAQIIITDGIFVVSTTADSGPGSLRQAILDSIIAVGSTDTVEFAIPGTGVHTIEPITSLPPITASLFVDGTTQPGFAGTPLIALGGQALGSSGPLTVSGGNVTIRGLAIDSVMIGAAADERLIAVVHTQGLKTRLSLLDSRGQVLVQSDGLAPGNLDDVIDQHLPAGTYALQVEGSGDSFTLTTNLTPANTPFQPISLGASYLDVAYSSVVSGDFNGDGHLDLAVANYGGDDVSVLLGGDDGTFQPPVQYAVGSGPFDLVTGDFNGDGHTDLVVANGNSGGTVSVLLGHGDGTFQAQVAYAAGAVSIAVVAGDFNGDGRLDLAVANAFSNTVSVLLGDGEGAFGPAVPYAVGVYPYALAAADFNGDGHLDLAVADVGNQALGGSDSGDVSVLLAKSDGTFRPRVTYAAGTRSSSLLVRDFNRDGHLDLAVTDYGDAVYGGTDSGAVSIFLGTGEGSFQPQVRYAVGSTPFSLVAGNFNGDEVTDLAVVHQYSGGLTILLGNDDGTFQQPVLSPLAYAPSFLVADDFNGDGRTDLVTTNSSNSPSAFPQISVLLGNGDGTFQQQPYLVGASPDSIVTGDFNGDGRIDLATANSSNTVSVLLGNGDGTVEPALQFAVGSLPSSLVTGDFNGDGRLDLAIANQFSNDVSILLGNGDGTFQSQVTYVVGPGPNAIVAGDFDGSGHLDLAVSCYNAATSESVICVLLGHGDGTFQPDAQYTAGSDPSSLVTGDFNSDGHLDLAVTNSNDNTVSVLLGHGNGTFRTQVTYAVGPSPDAIVAGDFDGSGHLDLAVACYNIFTSESAIYVLLAKDDGTFQPAVQYAVGSDTTSLATGDFNGDGRIDLAGANFQDYTVSVLLGNGNGTFQSQVTYAAGEGPHAIVAGDFLGNGRLGLAIANSYSDDVSVLLGTGDGTFTDASQIATAHHATPLVADVNGDGTDEVLVVDGAGDILYRKGIPGQPGSFEPPITIGLPDGTPYFSRDITWVPHGSEGPLLASLDARDDAISLFTWRDGGFARVASLATGRLPAQIIAADLNRDGWDDLVVRNAGDGTLSVYFGGRLIGPISPFEPPTFTAPLTIPVGLGVSDVQAIDTTGSGTLDLVFTDKLAGQVSTLRNLGDGTFAPPVHYRAGTGLSAIDPGSTSKVTSLEETAGVAAGSLTTGNPTDLIAINPGSHTMDILAGLGGGRFANPVALQTKSLSRVVRTSDFNHDGIPDLAVLSANGLSVYLGNGQGGFTAPVTYDAGPDPTGLTIADVNHDGDPDLLASDSYGDVLVLLGHGDGTFRPYHNADQSIELAVADLTGNGAKDVIYANQGLDRVVVEYASGQSTVLGDRAAGLLNPGAVELADLNGDSIPDLVVANSGSNNVLIYPGLGDGQFGPAVNGGHGYFVGTNPVGITVAKLTGALPDLVVADKGSNDVAILLNQGDFRFTAGPRLNSGGSGPVSTGVGDYNGDSIPDMLITDSGSNEVRLLPGVGQGFFNDKNPRSFTVGSNPVISFVGNFDGQTDLVTVNAGSNDLTVISGFEGATVSSITIPSGGVNPDTAIAFSADSVFDDLVVGNGGDGLLALFEGGPDGLSLTSVVSDPNLPDPTDLAFSALTGGQVQFYAATAGREAAELVALSLGIETAPISSSPGLPFANPVAQLVALHESSLPLVATVLTLTISVSGVELNLDLVATEATTVAAFLPGTGISVGQGLPSQQSGGPANDDGAESDESPAGVAGAVPAAIAPWERYVIGLDEALEKFQREHPNGVSGAPARDSSSDRPQSPPAAGLPAQGGPTSGKSGSDSAPSGDELDQTENASPSPGADAIDAIIESVWGKDRAGDSPERPSQVGWPSGRLHDVLSAIRLAVSPSSRSELSLAGSNRRTDEVLPPIAETGKDQPDLALTSLVVAVLTAEWGHRRRVQKTAKSGVERGSQLRFHLPGRASLGPSRWDPPESRGR